MLVVIFVAVFSIAPLKTAAQLIVSDPGVTAIQAGTAPANTGTNIATTLVEKVLKGVAIGIADQVLGKISTDLISWANNGFDGEPGFINNYSDFVKGVEFNSIQSSFNLASGIAQSVQQQSNQAAAQQLVICESEAYTDYNSNLSFMTEPEADYELEYQLTQCKIEASTNASINSYNSCFQNNEQAAINYASQIITGPSQQFFNDYFGGDASVNNEFFNIFSDDERLVFISDAQNYYEFIYKKNQCFNELLIDTLGGDPTQTAQNNYNLFQSGEINSTRAVAQTVADFGTERLNNNEFQQLASGGADLTLALLGSQGRKDDFRNDITAGGWDGILSLTGEGSTDLALTTTARVLVGNQSQQELALKEAALNLPTKLLDRTRCEVYRTDENGNTTEECLREVAVTPGDLVASQVSDALGSEARRGESFGDDLVGVLVRNLGNVVGGLVDRGFGSLTNAAVGSFFDAGDVGVQNLIQGGSGTNFQSDFNVLGIEPNANSNLLNDTGTSINTNAGGGISVLAGIGGPEDPNAQIVINFNEELENNIALAEEEKSYFDGIRSLTTGVVDVVYEFEKCIPGPDYKWDTRIVDSLDTQNDEIRLGINQMKSLVQDPQVTIPYGVEMADQIEIIFNTARTNQGSTQFRRDQLSRIINTMSFIQSEIQADFNVQKQDDNPDLVLFSEDWENLSQTQKTSILQYLVDNQLYINPVYVTDGGQTVLSDLALEQDEDKIRTAALLAAWTIWRNETPNADKLDLRESYYAIGNDLSNNQFVAIARSQFTEMATNIENSYEIALDCLAFKSYAIGESRATIAAISQNQNTQIGQKIQQLSELINTYNPSFSGNTVFGGNIPTFDTSSARSDAEIRSFLESERALQQSGGTSVFTTQRLTLPSAITNSILGFASETAKQEYFDTFYPDTWITHNPDIVGNRFSISDMYTYDIMGYTGTRGGNGLKGTLFCRIPGKFDRFASSNGGDDTTLCLNGSWYSISRLDLQLIVSEINI